jgi:hypothetical protein
MDAKIGYARQKPDITKNRSTPCEPFEANVASHQTGFGDIGALIDGPAQAAEQIAW